MGIRLSLTPKEQRISVACNKFISFFEQTLWSNTEHSYFWGFYNLSTFMFYAFTQVTGRELGTVGRMVRYLPVAAI